MHKKNSAHYGPFDQADRKRMLETDEPIIGWRRCLCGRTDCDAIRIFIVHPQIDDDSVVYATVPRDAIRDLVRTLREERIIE